MLLTFHSVVDLQVVQNAVLNRYLSIGLSIRSKGGTDYDTIEKALDYTVEKIKSTWGLKRGAVFLYLEGSSGIGKTQLAFTLNRKVLYLPFGK